MHERQSGSIQDAQLVEHRGILEMKSTLAEAVKNRSKLFAILHRKMVY